METDRMLSVQESADTMRVSKFTVWELVRHQKLAHYRLGRRIVIAEKDLAQFLSRNRREARYNDQA